MDGMSCSSLIVSWVYTLHTTIYFVGSFAPPLYCQHPPPIIPVNPTSRNPDKGIYVLLKKERNKKKLRLCSAPLTRFSGP